MKREPEYYVWKTMRQRCKNPNHEKYESYGGRGIRVCERWESYANFIEDMGRRPGSGYSLDRVDNDGDYEPGNVRWATQAEQLRNWRRGIMIEHNGLRLCAKDWAKNAAVSYQAFTNRIKAGWDVESALVTPAHGRRPVP